MDEKQLIFALDIGTRSVIGVVCAQRGEMFEVLGVESAEHTDRAMIDGQIEDIDKTAQVARTVKRALEEKLGIELHDVHVAAAGRILRTQRASFEMEMGDLPINRKQMFSLESRAVQRAYEELMAAQQEELVFCCAGYSVTQYTLDGYSFSTLLGHRGRKARVEIIASFLPNEVIESLYTTMEKTGLQVASVTLEPIAAMNAVIPQELRLLNIALVDIGAGTSDIAISSQGSVVAYTMSTVAGDEITEQAMREFLVDFETGERIKREAGLEQNDPLRYTDILGNEYETPRAEFLEKLAPAVQQLADSIVEKITEANGGPPTATFLVGGGSRTPGLRAAVAATLGVDEKKVAVGGINYIKRSVRAAEEYLSVEYATPVGIAITAIQSGDQREMNVSLNGKPVRMLNNSTLRVVDVLLRGGYEYRRIMGHSGQALTFTLNGQEKKLRGGIPTLARIEVNGAPAGITSPVQEGDKIFFQPAQDGEDASAVVGDLVAPGKSFAVELFGSVRRLGGRVWVNGIPAGPETPVNPGDAIETDSVETLGALLDEENLAVDLTQLTLNGRPCTEDDPLQDGDVIALAIPGTRAARPAAEPEPEMTEPEFEPEPAAEAEAGFEAEPEMEPEFEAGAEPVMEPQPAPEPQPVPQPKPAASVPEPQPAPQPQPAAPAAQPISQPAPAPAPAPQPKPAAPGIRQPAHQRVSPVAPEQRIQLLQITLNEKPLTLPPKSDGMPYQLFDLLNYVTDIDLDDPQGRAVLKKNGREVSFLEPIAPNDQVRIYWE